jgi:N-acetyl-alpha-D-muramate 1-phosphate uridylyltransferase
MKQKFAMVFAAGKGTRLGQISEHTPKALVEIAGKPLLFHVLQRLEYFKFTDVVVNVHHLAHAVVDYISQYKSSSLKIHISFEEDLLLDTGGGLSLASPFFQNASHVLLHNVDVITNLHLSDLYEAHIRSSHIATLAVKDRITSRYLLFDEQNLMKGWKNTQDGEEISYSAVELSPKAFSGVHVVSSKIFELMPPEPVFSMTTLYIQLCQNYNIAAYEHNNDMWVDVGKTEHFDIAAQVVHKMIASQ